MKKGQSKTFIKSETLILEAGNLLSKARREVGSAWRLIEDQKLAFKKRDNFGKISRLDLYNLNIY